MWPHTIHSIFFLLFISQNCHSITSPIQPYTTYKYSTELQTNVADLWWTVNEDQQEITFELHIKTNGWIALGISPAGGMKDADIGLGWIDQSGQLHFQDRYAYGFVQPVVDNTTIDWFGIQGRQENGWTAIQFKRALDTCDSMDVSIKSGTNILIFAYGVEDPVMSGSEAVISYHETRRGSRIIPLRSYNNPSPEEKFADLDYFDFRLNDYVIPAVYTTYHCKIYKAPADITEPRHAIGYKMLIDSNNLDIVHHLLLYECDPRAVYDDNNLPEGLCDDLGNLIVSCAVNLATAWAVGGDYIVEYPEIAGYPVGNNFEIKYYMIQIHYNNPDLIANRSDSSGIRFYLGNERRQYDLGYLTFGTDPSLEALAIPPKADQFMVDSYCTANMSYRFPASGITVFGAFPHTHLQGTSLWTKIIRNNTAVDYLFNAETYSFNYQFQNTLAKPIQLYPGDEFATRCVYSTTNKDQITLGGESTKEEMCLHIFAYYPRVSDVYTCLTIIARNSWITAMNASETSVSYSAIRRWLLELEWTQESIEKWQEFYNKASYMLYSGGSTSLSVEILPRLPKYEDLKPAQCKRGITSTAVSQNLYGVQVLILVLTTLITVSL